jgi:hypothetical protein
VAGAGPAACGAQAQATVQRSAAARVRCERARLQAAGEPEAAQVQARAGEPEAAAQACGSERRGRAQRRCWAGAAQVLGGAIAQTCVRGGARCGRARLGDGVSVRARRWQLWWHWSAGAWEPGSCTEAAQHRSGSGARDQACEWSYGARLEVVTSGTSFPRASGAGAGKRVRHADAV